jgi:hypothetical protein
MNKTSLFKISMPEQKSELIWFILISLLFVYPLIHADIYYRDDLTRVVSGAYVWDSLGRNLAAYFTAVLSGSGMSMMGQKFTLVDVAPLSQIYVVLFLGLTAYVFNEYLKIQTGKGVFWASLLIALNPFFIANILYRFDSPAMMFGVLLTVFAFCYASFFNKSVIITPLLLIVVLFMYQPMANIFIGLIAIEIIILSTRCSLSVLFKTCVVRSAQFISSYIVYYILIKLFFNVSSRSELVSLNFSGLLSVLDNFISYGHAARLFLHYSMKVPILIFLFITFISLLICLWQSKDKIKYCCVVVASLVFIFLSLAGPLALLQETLVDYRVIGSFYLFFIFGVIICSMANPKLAFIGILPAMIAINTSYQTGVALKNQRDFDENLFTLIQKDLLDNNIDGFDIYILGSAPIAPHAEIANSKNKFIEKINTPAAGWQAAGLLREKGVANVQYLFSAEFTSLQDVFKKDLCDEVPQELSKNALYSIYLSADKAYILLSTNQIKYCEEPL